MMVAIPKKFTLKKVKKPEKWRSPQVETVGVKPNGSNRLVLIRILVEISCSFAVEISTGNLYWNSDQYQTVWAITVGVHP